MIRSCIHRRILHHVFKKIYILAGYFYKVLKFLLRPLIYLNPRVHRFAIAIREAVKELIRPSEVMPNITDERNDDDFYKRTFYAEKIRRMWREI